MALQCRPRLIVEAVMELGLLIANGNDGAPKVITVKWWYLNTRIQKVTIIKTTAKVRGSENGVLNHRRWFKEHAIPWGRIEGH